MVIFGDFDFIDLSFLSEISCVLFHCVWDFLIFHGIFSAFWMFFLNYSTFLMAPFYNFLL